MITENPWKGDEAMINATINGNPVQVAENSTILEAARLSGVQIPTLCYLEGKEATGGCRVCLVEVEGAKNLSASCSTPVSEGMKIRTFSSRVREARKTVVELLLSEHNCDCQTCSRSGDCELQSLARSLGISAVRYEGARLEERIDESTRRFSEKRLPASNAGAVLRSVTRCRA